MIGVEDLTRPKKIYADGLGCKIEHDTPAFASFDLGNGSSLALYGEGGGRRRRRLAGAILVPRFLVPCDRMRD